MSPPLTGPIPHVLELGECFQRRPLRLVQATVEYLDLSPLSQGPGLTFVVALLAEGDGGPRSGRRYASSGRPSRCCTSPRTTSTSARSVGSSARTTSSAASAMWRLAKLKSTATTTAMPVPPVSAPTSTSRATEWADQVQRLLIVAAGRRKSHVSAGLLGRLDYPAASTGIDVGAQCVASASPPPSQP